MYKQILTDLGGYFSHNMCLNYTDTGVHNCLIIAHPNM